MFRLYAFVQRTTKGASATMAGVPPVPWYHVHVDFAGPYMITMLSVLVDAHSIWPDLEVMKKASTTETITMLSKLFTSYGVCREIVSDKLSRGAASAGRSAPPKATPRPSRSNTDGVTTDSTLVLLLRLRLETRDAPPLGSDGA